MKLKKFLCCTLPFLTLPLALAADPAPIDPHNPPQGRFSDEWAEIYMAGAKVGYVHSTMERDGDLIRSASTTFMQLGRDDQPVKITVTDSAVETLSGEPRSFETTQDLSIQKTTMKGAFKDGKVTITTSQFGNERSDVFDFPKGAVLKTWGSYRETLLKGFKPGTTYQSLVYEPAMRLDAPLDAETRVGDWKEFEHQGRKLRGQEVTLTLESPIGALILESWVDASGTPVRAKLPVPGMGDMEIIAVDQQTALKDFVPPEMFNTTVVRAKQSLDRAKLQRVRYRINPKKDHKVDFAKIPETPMQKIIARDEKSIELELTRVKHERLAADRKPVTDEKPEMSEFLGGNLMINTADPELIALAKRAAGDEKEPFALADKLRRFVSDYVETKNLNVGFATASEVARTREGDCSEHGILLAALGRLNELPSRVVVGIAYVPIFGNQDDIFGYHMWTQFYIDNRWIDFDAALNESNCSPTRIAFGVSSLKNAGIADLSLPLLTLIGAIDIDILATDE